MDFHKIENSEPTSFDGVVQNSSTPSESTPKTDRDACSKNGSSPPTPPRPASWSASRIHFKFEKSYLGKKLSNPNKFTSSLLVCDHFRFISDFKMMGFATRQISTAGSSAKDNPSNTFIESAAVTNF